jgi:hypothetical protein
MKEHDVRQRIESFLKRTAREVVIPVSMGLSMALSGCSDVPSVYPPYGAVPPFPDASARDGGLDVGVPDASMDAAVPDAAVDDVALDTGVDEGLIDEKTD